MGRRNISNLLRIIWHGRSDLRAAFDQTNVSAQLALTEWWEQSGESQYSTFSRLHFSELKNETETGLLQTNLFANASSTAPELQDHLSSQTGSILEKPPGDIEYLTVLDQPTTMMPMVEPITQIGMNLIGFARGVLGLGEDIRMATMACQQAAIPIAVIDAPIPGPVKEDDTLNELLVEDLRYPISVFFMPPTEMIRWAMQGGVDLINTEAYNIGAWPWELPYWPEEFGQVHELVDEIWAQSKFVASVFQRITDKPVTYMPMAVAIPAPLNYSRDRFNFPKSDFLFFMMFDGNSWLSRKNPLAGVQAFVKAFPLNTSGVGLVIKAMNINTVDTQWQALLSMVANDPRVIIVNDKMPRQDSIDLMACCDAYISLHRSEGFGRVIAEAMLLGKPTIATNFSGNIDFCNTSTSYLVDGELVPLQKGDYLFFEGQYWCDPDVNIASERMLQLFEDKSKRERIALAGKHYIEEHHSIAAVSRAYAIRLGEIESKLERLI